MKSLLVGCSDEWCLKCSEAVAKGEEEQMHERTDERRQMKPFELSK